MNSNLVSVSPVSVIPGVQASSIAAAAAALKNGEVGEFVQKIKFDRLLIDPPAGGTPISRLTFEMFAHTRAMNPELTNLVEAGRMGPNEAFQIEGVSIQANFGCSEAGLVKFLADARLRIGVGPDDVERLHVPAVFLPSGNGIGAGLIAQCGKPFYELAKGQEINLKPGHPFSVRLIQGPNAQALADVEIVDLFVKLFGTYQQGVIR